MRFLDRFRPPKQPPAAQASTEAQEAQARRLIESGNSLEDAGHFEEARQQYLAALELMPELPQAHLNLGNVLLAMGELQAALDAYSAALRYKPDYASAHFNQGNAYVALRRLSAAVRCYEKALAIRPDFVDAWVSLGYAQHDLGHYAEALRSYDRALAIRPDYPQVYLNRGHTCIRMEHYAAAVESYGRAIALRPDYAEAYYNQALAFIKLNQREAAVENLDRVLALDPDYGFARGVRLHAKMHICDWRDHDHEIRELAERVERGLPAASSFAFLGLSTSGSHQRHVAELWTRSKYPASPALGPIPKRQGAGKIRVGYFSGDFCNHPVAFLTAGLFEAHDRDAFEIIAFSYGQDTRDEMRRRLEGAFDRFISVGDRSDAEIAQLARDIGIDIAVDLAGHTAETRTGIFALRAAPIQVNYLGFPGTMGADYMDYMIGDNTVVPAESRCFYTEKLAYLPCFQVNDAQRLPAARRFSRTELGLPEGAFVFCCFNNTYKITPSVFDSWMRILTQVDHSVLFLYADNAVTIRNLRNEAYRRGVDPNRLVFGERLSIVDYLSRYCEADLFLDTLPFNAGTTASDALWAGLPLLTCTGEAFASRMAASLLTALDLPELITSSPAEYEARAVALALNPSMLASIRERLSAHRTSSTLFDTAYFTGRLETAYRQMLALHRAGQAPEHIHVPA
jgi:predicted O-linked N-acetylglucosamine transferase (SPINDLY family)